MTGDVNETGVVQNTFLFDFLLFVLVALFSTAFLLVFDFFDHFLLSLFSSSGDAVEVVFKCVVSILIAGNFLLLRIFFANRSLKQNFANSLQEKDFISQRYQLATEGSHDGIWDWDIRTGQCFYSDVFLKNLGFTSLTFPPSIDSFYGVMKHDDVDRFDLAIQQHILLQKPIDLECLLRTTHAGYRWFRITARTVFNSEGQLERVVGSIRDIQYRIGIQKALNRELDRVAYIFKRSPILIVVLDRSGVILNVNPTMCKTSGYEELDLIGCDWRDVLFSPNNADDFQSLNKYLREQGEVSDYEITLTTKFGVERIISWTTLNRYDQNAKIDEIVCFGVDITDKNTYQKQLVDAKDEAERANAAKSDFLAGMSHEIRTPMNGVIGTASLLSDTKLTKKQSSYVNTIIRSGRVLLEIINEILDYSKIESGTLDISKDVMHLRHSMEDLVQLLMPVAQEKNLDFIFEYDKALPNWIYADDIRIKQVITNFTSNAIKFSTEGSVKLFIEKKEQDTREFIKFSVQDNGVGIKLEDLDTVFKPFEQIVEGRKTAKIAGTGLGLAICKRLVEMMSGEIGVDSAYENGSIFWFQIPLEHISDAALRSLEAVDAQTENADDVLPQTFDAHILVAEDVATNQFIIQDMLEGLGCRVDIADDGKQALDIMKEHGQDFDFIFMDCNMPEMDGYDATRHIRELGFQDLPIVALTAHAMQEEREKCMAAGMSDFLSKPVEKSMVIDVLAKWIKSSD